MTQLIETGPAGNRWFKVNLHAHGQGHDPAEVVRRAREAEIDLIAITDHQTFHFFSGIAQAADTPGRPLVVLPGIEITTPEGVHLLAIFPKSFNSTVQHAEFFGVVKLRRDGDTKQPAREPLDKIMEEVHRRGGIIVVPHPKTPGIGILDSARKIGIKVDWLESGHIRLMQAAEDVVQYVARDDQDNFVNRYVLATARPKDIAGSTYCLAPFNRSDSHTLDEIPEGCSWFWMQEPSVAGLKQVGCEPRTRISRTEPPAKNHDCILAIRVSGGYCDGQVFFFNDGLTCVVGQNYAGKSAVFDFVRFGLGTEVDLPEDLRPRFWDRLHGILQEEGSVEVFVRSDGQYYVSRRTFRAIMEDRRGKQVVIGCDDEPAAYRFDADRHDFEPAADFSFPLEVYEQGRIFRLRDDVQRQLEMLDEFAQLGPVKQSRDRVIADIRESGRFLKPLYEQQEELKTALADLPDLEKELKEKAKLIPDPTEDQKWAASDGIVDEIEAAITGLRDAVNEIPAASAEPPEEEDDAIASLFGQCTPHVDETTTAEPTLLTKWASTVKTAVDAIERARQSVVAAVTQLENDSTPIRQQWEKLRKRRHDTLRAQLAKANVESPTELTRRVRELRQAVTNLKTVQQPKLVKVQKEIRRREQEHVALVKKLSGLDRKLTEQRTTKAQELTDSLGDQIRVTLRPAAQRDEYEHVLDELCDRITNRDSRISDRKPQLRKITDNLLPLDLATALTAKGACMQPDGSTVQLHTLCGVTENTQNVLCRIADNIELLTQLQTITVADVPHIEVRRRGDNTFASLVSGLSQGEQSAAILTMALQTRRRPLIIDQPEDELGYNYVVHLVVPKILETKGTRQILVITHNANVPVLGDADYVLKMENEPLPSGGRRCIVENQGCFESSAITHALMELDGGRRAFEFRQYRYALPK